MPRPAKGNVFCEGRFSTPTWYMRFTANGERHTIRLGPVPEWSEARANEELARTMALVHHGDGSPHSPLRRRARCRVPCVREQVVRAPGR
jgi:hypothetical protein